jgi:GMP synthase (glutamine-hydrolysing)
MAEHVLILNMMVDPTLNDPVGQWSRYLGAIPHSSVHIPSGEPIPDLDGFTHLLITGSEASTVDPQAWMSVAAERIREAADRGLQVLGNCFGHQMIVWSLSGRAFTRNALCPEIGWIEARIEEDDPLLFGVSPTWRSFTFHMDEVCDLPPPWRTLAGNAACRYQAIRFGDRPIWGIQPHPEITPEEGARLLESAKPFIEEFMPEHLPLLQQAIAQVPRDDDAAQTIVSNFLSYRSDPR